MPIPGPVEIESGAYTPESQRARRRLIESMMASATSTKPVGHWTQVLAQALQGGLAGYDLGQLERKEAEERQRIAAGRQAGVFGGGADAALPAAPATLPTGGGAGEVAATPAPAPVVPVPPAAVAGDAAAPAATLTTPPVPGMADYKRAVSGIETGGQKDPYAVVGPKTRTGDQAYGKYQVMGRNIPTWTTTILGRQMTPQEFLADPDAQERVFEAKFGEYVNRFGNPEDAASAWFSGRPRARAGNAADVLGTTVPSYVEKFRTALGAGNGPGAVAVPPAPVPTMAGGAVSPQPAAVAAPAVPSGAPPIAPTPAPGTQAQAGAIAPTGGLPTRPSLPDTMARAPAPPPIQPFLRQVMADPRNRNLAIQANSTNFTLAERKAAQDELMMQAQAARKASMPLTPEEVVARRGEAAKVEKTEAEARKTLSETVTPEESKAGLQATIAGARRLVDLPGFEGAVRLSQYSLPVGINAGSFGALGGDLATAPRAIARMISPDSPAWSAYEQMNAMKQRLSLAAQRIYLKGQGQVTENERTAVTEALGELNRPTSLADWQFRLNSVTKMLSDLDAGKRLDPGTYTTQPTTDEIASVIDMKSGTFSTDKVQALAQKYNVRPKDMQDYIVGLTRPPQSVVDQVTEAVRPAIDAFVPGGGGTMSRLRRAMTGG